MKSKTLYDQDFSYWIDQTVEQLRSGRWSELDVPNLIDELESIGKRDQRELENRLTVLLMHLLKWKYQPKRRCGSWINTLREQRRQIGKLLRDSPSLKPYLTNMFGECYADSRLDAVGETQLSPAVFPIECPFSVEDVLAQEFLPD
jgi:hypothetical protein